MTRPRAELEALLRSHYGFLMRSADAFDAGHRDESRRLAVTVRVLVHDGQSTALLHQLGLRKRLRFVDTAYRQPALPRGAIVMGGSEFAVKRADFDRGVIKWVPVLDDLTPERVNPTARFHDWWTDKLIHGDDGTRYSRRDLVLGMANSDGAHVDHRLDGDYAALLAMTAGVAFVRDGEPQPSIHGDLASVSMRQIAHEVRRTLERDWRVEPILRT